MKRNNGKHLCELLDGTGLHRHFIGTSWRPLQKRNATASLIFFLLFLLLCVAALLSAGWIDTVSSMNS